MKDGIRNLNFISIALVALLFVSCGVDANTSPDLPPIKTGVKKKKLTTGQKEAISYFLDIAIGFEFGDTPKVTRKWDKKLKLYVGGKPSNALRDELNDIIDELNDLTSESEFSVNITSDSLNSNGYLYFGAGSTFAKKLPVTKNNVTTNWGLFQVWYNDNNDIRRMAAYVDIYRAKDLQEQKHLLREELTQSLGMGNDSPLYNNSIFQSDPISKITRYSKLDREVIQLLYNPEIKTGLGRGKVRTSLQDIVDKVVS